MLSLRRSGWGILCILSACLGDLGDQDLSDAKTPASANDPTQAELDHDTDEDERGHSSAASPSARPGDEDAGAPEHPAPFSVPSGFAVNVFASDVGDARSLVAHAGHIYVVSSLEGEILRLDDSDGDGVAEQRARVAECFEGAHGLVFHRDTAYFATPSSLFRAQVREDGSFGEPVAIVKSLPSGGIHPKHALSTDSTALYLSTGSSCENCVEQNGERATVVRVPFDGSARGVVARGLRNPLAMAFLPSAGKLWSLDTRARGGERARTLELNAISEGKDYGWPYCFGTGQVDNAMSAPPTETAEAYCARTTVPTLTAEVDAEPAALSFAKGGALPEPYGEGAFVSLRGVRNEDSKSRVSFIVFRDGTPLSIEDFAIALAPADDAARIALSGLAVAGDGSVLIADDVNGRIYRVHAY